jgi:hypothetical protein
MERDEVLTLKVLARVAPDFRGIEEDGGSIHSAPMWAMTVVGNSSTITAKVRLTRVDKADAAHTAIPAQCKSDLRTMFSYDNSGAFVASEEVAGGTYFCYSNLLSVLVTRALHVVFPLLDGEAATHIRIKPVVGMDRGFEFDCTLPVSFDDPLTFGYQRAYSVVDLAGSVEKHEELDVGSSEPEGPYVVAGDQSDNMGDVRGAGPVFNTAFYTPAPDTYMGEFDQDSQLYDANLFADSDPHEKYAALAHIISRSGKDSGGTLIVGDHPGSLGRALADLGVDSVGLDPLNENSSDKTSGTGAVRTLVRGGIGVGEGVADKFKELGIGKFRNVVVDTGLLGEAAEVATARNLALAKEIGAYCKVRGSQWGGFVNVFVQLRSAPLSACDGYIFLLPGVSKLGCEVYALLHPLEAQSELLEPFSFAKFRASAPGIEFALNSKRPQHDVYDQFYPAMSDGWRYIQPDQWYNFIVSRFHTEAARQATGDFFSRACTRSKNAFELFYRLDEGMLVTERVRADARSLFESGRVSHVSGIPPGLLDRVPGMRAVVAARYRRLIAFCAHTRGDAPQAVLQLMADPRSGALLSRLSELRVSVGQDVELAKYDRVLAYESMAILASKTFYRALRLYIPAVRTVVGKPMHTWELQYLLWSLTHLGTRGEKIRYLTVKLEDIVLRERTGRRPSAVATDDGTLRTFARKLDDLGKRNAMVQQDFGLAKALASNTVFTRRGSYAGFDAYSGERGRARPPSVSSSGVPPISYVTRGGSSARPAAWGG